MALMEDFGSIRRKLGKVRGKYIMGFVQRSLRYKKNDLIIENYCNK